MHTGQLCWMYCPISPVPPTASSRARKAIDAREPPTRLICKGRPKAIHSCQEKLHIRTTFHAKVRPVWRCAMTVQLKLDARMNEANTPDLSAMEMPTLRRLEKTSLSGLRKHLPKQLEPRTSRYMVHPKTHACPSRSSGGLKSTSELPASTVHLRSTCDWTSDSDTTNCNEERRALLPCLVPDLQTPANLTLP